MNQNYFKRASKKKRENLKCFKEKKEKWEDLHIRFFLKGRFKEYISEIKKNLVLRKCKIKKNPNLSQKIV